MAYIVIVYIVMAYIVMVSNYLAQQEPIVAWDL